MSEGLPLPTLYDLRAELARRHYLDFIDFTWQRNDRFLRGLHTNAIGEAMDHAFTRYDQGNSTWLCIQVPYRHGKSDLGSRYLPPYFLGRYPHAEAMVVAYGTDLAHVFSRFARQVMRDERYQAVFPGVQLAMGNRAVNQWSITAPDGRELGKTYWLGINGGATGKGANLLVGDDLFKNREEAESPTIRDKVWDGLVSNILTRLAPVSIVVFLATPWHVDDQFGRIKSKMREDANFPRYEFLTFPAFGDRVGRTYHFLFPERFKPDWYIGQEALLGKYAAAGLLQCDPIARGGNVLKTEQIHFYDKLPDHIPLSRGWDLASTEKQRVSQDPDWTVGSRVGVEWLPTAIEGEQLPVVYIDDVIDGQWDAPKRDEVIKGTAIADGRIPVGVEAFGAYKDAAKTAQKALKGIRSVREVRLPGDKLSKASTLEVAMAAGNVWMRTATWNERVLKQMSQWPAAPHDDIVDSITVAIAIHAPYESHVWPQASALVSKRFDIAWNQTEVDVRCMHYAGIWMGRDLALYVVAALWDAPKGRLLVYDGFRVEPEPDEVAKMLMARMHLLKYKVSGIYCNDEMAPAAPAVSIQRQVNNSLSKLRAPVSVRPSRRYDELGAIMRVRHFISDGAFFVHTKASDALSAWATWTIKNGRATDENDGYCRALCLIASEVTRVEQAKQPRRRPADYKPVASERQKT